MRNLPLLKLCPFHLSVRSRRGTAMIEASLVLPLIILSVLTCILIVMFFYDTTISQCQLHEALRCEAGRVTGHTSYLDPPDTNPDSLTVSRQGLFKVVSGKEHTAMIEKGLLYHRVSAQTESLWHACDGVSYVRYCTLAREITEDR